MSSEEFERRINNQLAAIVENQARNDAEISKILEAVAGMVQVARSHEERLDRQDQQIAALIQQGKDQDERIAGLAEQGKEQQERIDALIRIVEGHITNHP